MANLPEIEVKPCGLERLEELHLRAIGDVDKDDVLFWRDQVARGQVVCARVMADNRRVGTIIYSFENEGEAVFVVNALYCEPDSAVSYLNELMEWGEQFARLSGAVRTRFYTRRGGLETRFAKRGYERRVMMEKRL